VIGPGCAAKLLSELREAPVEVLAVLPVEGDLHSREIETIAIGSMMSVTVEARNIFSHSVSKNDGRSLVIAHNHAFQRKAEPSVGDREFMHGIQQAGRILGVPILDGIVIGEEEYFSFLEHGLLFEKGKLYKVQAMDPEKTCPFYPVSVGRERISSPKDVADLIPFLRKESLPTTVVIHLTPDFEAVYVQAFRSKVHPSAMEEARWILRETIRRPSTKYIVLANNHSILEKRSQYHDDLTDRLSALRVGATLLCIPVVDMVVLEERGFYSFAEHGRVFPKSSRYIIPENEGLKLKGPPKTRRADIPPYSWTFR
jgi:DNA repair protein RadC